MKTCARCGKTFKVRNSNYCSLECSGDISKNKKHGLSGTKEHATWLDMRYRCRNPNHYNYHRYGGRGITVCERWDDFMNFLEDMGKHPGKGYTIERIDNNGNYEPGNCKWGTKKEQSQNRSCCWTTEQDRELADLLERGLTFPQIGKILGRKPNTVSSHAKRIGLRSRNKSGGRWPRRMDQHPSTASTHEAD